MNTNENLTITNAWICQISGQNIIPVFGDILISKGRISNIIKKDFKSFFHNHYKVLIKLLMPMAE